MFCKHCGKQIYENSGICPHCGATVIEEKKNYEGEYHSGYEKSETSTKKIIILVIAIVLVIAIGVSAFFIGKKITDDKLESIRQSEKEREEERKKENDNAEVILGFGEDEEYEVTTVKVENYGSVPLEEETDNSLLNIETRFGHNDIERIDVTCGGDLFQLDPESKITMKCMAALNDCAIKDSFRISKKVTDGEDASAIKSCDINVEIFYNKLQTAQVTDLTFEYNSILIATSGDYVNTIVFMESGVFVYAFDVIKGAESTDTISNTLATYVIEPLYS